MENEKLWSGDDHNINALIKTIKEFHHNLPGWWFSIGECNVSCDASCGPTSAGRDAKLLDGIRTFDDGFHVDLKQPSTLAEALKTVMIEAMSTRKRYFELIDEYGEIPKNTILNWHGNTPNIEKEFKKIFCKE